MPEERLAANALAANARIHELSQSNAEHAGMGTTLTAVYVGAEEVAIAHVGDSRAYCLRDGELLRLTDDHSLVDELIREGRLTPEEAEEHPQRSIITRALGPEETVEVDTRSFRARAGDVYLLCSDGLTSMVPEARLAEILSANRRLHDAGEALIAEANRAGGRDNITVILLRVEEVGAGYAEAVEDDRHATLTGVPPAATSPLADPPRVAPARHIAAAPPAPPRPPRAGDAARRRRLRRVVPSLAAADGARSAAGRGLHRRPVGLLHRHQQPRAGDDVSGLSLRASGRDQALQQLLRLRCERLDAEPVTTRQLLDHRLRTRSRSGLADTQPGTGTAERMSGDATSPHALSPGGCDGR